MTKQIIDEDAQNEAVLESIEGDFDTFLAARNFRSCDAIIDNLRDMGKYEKAVELLKRMTARKMTVPEDYGKKEWWQNGAIMTAENAPSGTAGAGISKKPTPIETVASQFNTINKALYGVEPFKKSEEELIF